MDFNESLRQFSVKAANLKSQMLNEEMTKMSLILPFFKILGYDVFDPTEFTPEYVADVGIKKGEKVDYAIMKNGNPVILIEAKWCGENLNIHIGQLYRYFSVSTAKFGILTNGIDYKFYTDLEAQHKMDLSPFLEFNLINIKDDDVSEIEKFHKDIFNVDELILHASELKYLKLIKNYFTIQLQRPTDDFTLTVLGAKVNKIEIYPGKKTKGIIEKFKPLIKKSLTELIDENKKAKTLLSLERQETSSGAVFYNNNENPIQFKNLMKKEELVLHDIKEKNSTQKTFLQCLESALPEVQNIYRLLKDYVLSLGNDVTEKQLKFYVAFKKIKNIICVEIYRNKVQIYLRINPKSVKLEENFTKACTFTIYGSCNLLVIMKNIADFERVKPLIDRVYNEN